MNLWVTIFIAGLLTYTIRLSFILLLERFSMPDWFRRALRFVPAAVMSAIILPGLVDPNSKGQVDISLYNAQFLAGVIAILVAWRTKNVLLTIVVGMLALLIIQALITII